MVWISSSSSASVVAVHLLVSCADRGFLGMKKNQETFSLKEDKVQYMPNGMIYLKFLFLFVVVLSFQKSQSRLEIPLDELVLNTINSFLLFTQVPPLVCCHPLFVLWWQWLIVWSSGQTQVYEDDGSSVDYINDGFTWTKVSYTRYAPFFNLNTRVKLLLDLQHPSLLPLLLHQPNHTHHSHLWELILLKLFPWFHLHLSPLMECLSTIRELEDLTHGDTMDQVWQSLLNHTSTRLMKPSILLSTILPLTSKSHQPSVLFFQLLWFLTSV